MADITGTIATLVAGINRAANRALVNKRSCNYLSLKCSAILKRVENGELAPKTDPTMKELIVTLELCRTDLRKFSGLGFAMRLIRSGSIPEINKLHSENLDMWLAVAIERLSDREVREEARDANRFKNGVARHQNEGIAILQSGTSATVSEVPTVLRENLELGEKVGKFPFGTIFKGYLKNKDGSLKSVYIRELRSDLTGVDLQLVWTSIRLNRCLALADPSCILAVHGICQGRMIVTDTTAHGPLNELTLKDDRVKVAIALKVAGALISIHDIAVGNECVVHRDIRAANILIDQGSNADAEMEPKITGFEMCKQSTSRTGKYPEIDVDYRRWWSPERAISGTSTKSDVFAFGLLMYEISTGKEPEVGQDFVKVEDMRICPQYTDLMESCLDSHYDARPSMLEVAQRLVSIETILMSGTKEP